MAGEAIFVERSGDGRIAHVVLNRPEKLNALDLAAWRRLAEVMRELDRDDALRCVIVRGVDGRAFAAGADISAFERERADAEQARIYAHAVHAAMESVSRCRHPVVAAIRGVCVGGGLELACACDLRIAGDTARFGIPIKRLGLTLAYDELRMLLSLVGPAHAAEILLEGRIFGAERAKEMGLVNRVVPDAEVMAEAEAAARRIAEGAPLVARWHKKFIRRLLDPTPLTPAEIEEGFAALDTEDYRRGVRAFLSKTEPEFVGA
ncbi:putative enoyl-CoA hydratase echA8 [bacterium HR39]|nr:putative enoyl-CoA hydratase echA8 [bacterium HR39]